jgi:hypothetical protein
LGISPIIQANTNRCAGCYWVHRATSKRIRLALPQRGRPDSVSVRMPGRKIRFRSSSNVEDGETFTGAGLYDSYSGCLLDDLDGGSTGPSRCDPTQPEKRGVFRAMQKVYARFYNDNAVIERLRRAVDESKAGMGLLVHHSYPNDIELANGVATYHKSGDWFDVRMVTQTGAVSVTNPDSSAQPEVVDGPDSWRNPLKGMNGC